MTNRPTHYPPPYDRSERTAVLERDLHHIDARMNDLANTVDATNNRLHTLAERIRTAEHTLHMTTRDLEVLQTYSTQLAAKIPDLEAMVRTIKWLLDAMKYLAGLAILAGAIAGGETMQALKAIFG